MSSTVARNVKRAGLCIALGFRCIILFPFFFAAISQTHYDILRDMKGVYDVEPAANALVEGLRVVDIAANVGGFWNFAALLLNVPAVAIEYEKDDKVFNDLLLQGIFTLLTGSLDLAVAVPLIVGLSMQGTLLPATYTVCNVDAEKSYFFVAAYKAINDHRSLQSMCRAMVWDRSFAAAITFFYSVVTVCNLLVGIGVLATLEGFPKIFSKMITSVSTLSYRGRHWGRRKASEENADQNGHEAIKLSSWKENNMVKGIEAETKGPEGRKNQHYDS